MLTSAQFVRKQASKFSSQQEWGEWWNCRRNPFYFIFNYVNIPEIGGMLKYEESRMHSKMKQTVRSITRFHRALLMATRQLGKSTISAALLEWACNFYPRMPATILNANKTFALENLDKVKFIHNELPAFLRNPLKFRGERKTTIDYTNDSILRVFYPSSSTSPSTLARSLTSPILYIDEAAHIKHMRQAYGSAQPTLSRARDQAKKHGYPYFILITSTPNGTVGDGEWFFNMWQNAVDSVDIFDGENQVIDECQDVVHNPERNGFVRIRFHWSEDKTKDDNWYNEQKRDLNFDTRLINQELDLVFVGSTNCIFSDEFLGALVAQAPVDRLKLPHATILNLFTHRNDLDKSDYLIIGCDTAKSLVGDYSSIEIYNYSNMVQIGEYFGRLGSLTKYSDCIMGLVDVLAPLMNNRIILAIENNAMGNSIIEDLENATNHDYLQYVYSPDPEKYVGINTNAKTKSAMVTFFYDYIIDEPGNIKSSDLINQLNVIERKVNGSISAQSGYHDDLFMASSLCSYARRLSSLEFEPLLGVSTVLQQQRHVGQIQSALSVSSASSNGNGIQARYNAEEGGIEYILYDHIEDETGLGEDETPFSFV